MPNITEWILAALSVFTISFILTKMDMFIGLRTRLGCYDYGTQAYPDGSPRSESALGRWVACPMCMSLFPVAPMALLILSIGLWQVLGWLGIAGVAILMFRWRSW